MQGCKHWACSKTIRSAIVALVMLGIVVVGMWQKLDVKDIVFLATAIAGVLGTIYGRAAAKERIGREKAQEAQE